MRGQTSSSDQRINPKTEGKGYSYSSQLEAKLQDKESQRKELLSYLCKPNKKNNPDKKPLGKKPGSIGSHPPKPKPEEITERHAYTLTRCPGCRGPVGEAVDKVIKYEEVPANIAKQIKEGKK